MKTIDITPTWEALALHIAEIATNGTSFQARKIGEEELIRMAKLADLYVAIKKAEKNEKA
jgi:hypothetical protein